MDLTRQIEASTVYIEPTDERGTDFGRGTGTLVRNGETRVALVTNWHVIAGREFARHERITSTLAGYPNRLRVWVYDNRGGYRASTVALFDRDGRPSWAERATPADVVALPFDYSNLHVQVMTLAHIDTDVAVVPTEHVSVVGFPEGLAGRDTPPVWKGGQLATQLDWPAQPGRFLVDAITAPGMSGSGVYAVRRGTWTDRAGNVVTCPDPVARWIGVFAQRQVRSGAGRATVAGNLLSADEQRVEVRGTLAATFEVDLGLAAVWSAALIPPLVGALPR